MIQLWSWALTGLGIVATVYIGRKNPVGWLIAFCAQGVWIAYAIAVDQYGFVVSSILYAGMNCRNWLAWRQQDRDVDSGANVGSEADSVELSSMRELD